MHKQYSINQGSATSHLSLIHTGKLAKAHPAIWSNVVSIFMCLVASMVILGCASTKVSNQERVAFGELPKPNNILVHEFAASASELPANSALYSSPDLDTTPQTDAQISEGKKLGILIATNLATEINNMGMPAELAKADAQPQINDMVIIGYLISVKEGSEGKRIAIGFGKGSSDLQTAVEVFQMTTKGLRKLGSGNLNAVGAKTPGGVLGLATLIATRNPAGLIISGGIHAYGEISGSSKLEGRAKQTAEEISDVLKKRFQEQGWI